MDVRRFTGRTTRDAMARVRMALGSEAIVLKNRAMEGGGVEILAMPDHSAPAPARRRDGRPEPLNRGVARALEAKASFDDFADGRFEGAGRGGRPAAPAGDRAAPIAEGRDRADREDRPDREDRQDRADREDRAGPTDHEDRTRRTDRAAAQDKSAAPMSTLTFQQYVRERLARRHDSKAGETPVGDERDGGGSRSARSTPSAPSVDAGRDGRRERERDYARDEARQRELETAREVAGEAVRQAAREAAREATRETAREAAREAAREVIRESLREAAQLPRGDASEALPMQPDAGGPLEQRPDPLRPRRPVCDLASEMLAPLPADQDGDFDPAGFDDPASYGLPPAGHAAGAGPLSVGGTGPLSKDDLRALAPEFVTTPRRASRVPVNESLARSRAAIERLLEEQPAMRLPEGARARVACPPASRPSSALSEAAGPTAADRGALDATSARASMSARLVMPAGESATGPRSGAAMSTSAARSQAVAAAGAATRTAQPSLPAPSLAQVLDSATPAAPGQSAVDARLVDELREMRGLIASQLSSLAWLDGVRRNPLQVQMLRKLIGHGFSSQLSRKLVSRMPADDEAQALAWIRQTLVRLMRCEAAGSGLLDNGGIYALVGPTGVGKTTSAAKIAAQFALRHGVQSVGLLTVDAYRIGAQDQLRTFGRLLGVPVHVAHDAGTLAEFLHLFMNKKLVLIDTVGVGQRDERVAELLGSLGSAAIGKLVVLNASAQPETLEDVIVSYQAESAAGVVLSKVDEAVKTAGVLDCVIRHRLKLVGVANGQRVPEDWHLPDGQALLEQAMIERPVSAFDLDDSELAMVLAPAAPVELMRAGAERIGGGRHV